MMKTGSIYFKTMRAFALVWYCLSGFSSCQGSALVDDRRIVDDVTNMKEVTDDDDEERAVLMALYESTGGSQWRTNINWNTSASICTWYGVTCSTNQTLRVSELDLSYNNLDGFLPIQLGNLIKLKSLQLQKNYYISGSIPSELGNCTLLEILDLSDNQIQGSIPPEIGNLHQLKQLDLSSNHYIKGKIPPELGNLSILEVLDLSKNEIHDSIPAQLGELSKLTSLTLTSNHYIRGIIPPELGKLSNLEYLSLEENHLQGKIPRELGNLSQLVWLCLNNNDLQGEIPPELGKLTRLTTLTLSYNYLEGEIPSELGLLSKIQYMYLSNNYLSGQLPEELANCSSMSLFSIASNTDLHGPVPASWCSSWSQLLGIDLSNVKVSGPIPISRNNGSSWPMLEQFMASNSDISGEIPMNLSALWPNILRFQVDNNRLSGNLPSALSEWTSCSIFNVSNNLFGATLPAEYAAMSELEYFDVSHNSLSGTLPASYSNWKKLQYFFIANTQLSGPIPAEYTEWSRLYQFYARNTYLTGSISKEIVLSWYANMMLFDISTTRIAGTIPEEICKWSRLTVLDISYTGLTGSLPGCISTLESLETIIASHSKLQEPLPQPLPIRLKNLVAPSTKLSGPLPSLSGATHLQTVILHNNHFHGSMHNLHLSSTHRIQRLTLHNNHLTGHVKDLEYLKDLNYLTLQNNNFQGRMPKLKVQNDPSIIISNNRLSCRLHEMHNHSFVYFSLVLPGNSFSAPLPSWVQYTTSFLYVSRGWHSQWVLVFGKMGIYAVIFTCIILLTKSTIDRCRQRESNYQFSTLFVVPSTVEIRPSNSCTTTNTLASAQLSVLFEVAAFWFGGLALIGLVLIQPAAFLGSNYYECGDSLLMYMSISQLADSPTAEWLASIGICLCAVCTTIFIFRLHSKDIFQQAIRDNGSTDANIPASPEEKRLRFFSFIKSSISITIWLLLLLFTNALTVLYLATYSLPNDNSIPVPSESTLTLGGVLVLIVIYCHAISAHTTTANNNNNSGHHRTLWSISFTTIAPFTVITFLWTLGIVDLSFSFSISNSLSQKLAAFIPIYISILNSSILPSITKPFASMISGGKYTAPAMLLLARLVSLLVIPIITLTLMSEGCEQGWRKLFTPCRDSSNILQSVVWSDTIVMDLTTTQVSATLLSKSQITNDVCSTTSLSAVNTGLCLRNIFWVLIPLYLMKLAFQALGWPALVLFFSFWGQSVGITTPYTLVTISSSDAAANTSRSRMRTFSRYSVRLFLWLTVTSTEDGQRVVLDNEVLMVATYLELALLIGPFCPLYSVLTLLAICINGWTYRASLQLLGKHAELSPAINIGLITKYLTFSNAIFVITGVLFFRRNRFHGDLFVTYILVTAYCTLVAAITWKEVNKFRNETSISHTTLLEGREENDRDREDDETELSSNLLLSAGHS